MIFLPLIQMKSVSHSFNDQDIPFIDSEDPETKLGKLKITIYIIVAIKRMV